MTHTRQSFLIPELNIVANDAQLKNMQRKMLFEHYAKDSQQKLNKSESEKKTYRNFYNPQNRADTQMDLQYMKNSVAYNKSFGIDLAHSYEKEIQMRQAKKRYEKQMERQQEQQMIKLAQSQLYLDKIRNQQMHQTFKREAHEDLQQKQRRKAEQRKRLQQEKQSYQRRYSTNLLSLNKQQSFRKHYINVSDAIQKNERNYLNSVAPANRYKQYEKQRLIQNSIKVSQKKLRQQLQQQFAIAEKHRSQLRDSLVMQIRQKEQKKKQQVDEMRSQGYTSNAYLHRHHPINNPVDFKITHDNRYIMKELQSGLARSGSQSLI